MSKIFEKFKGILFFLFCAGMCTQCTKSYINGGDKELIANYETMINDKLTVEAELYSEYKEVTLKVMKVPVKTYDFKYHFEIDNQKYEGEKTFYQLPTNTKLKVYYLKNNPAFNCEDPVKLLLTEKEKNSSKTDLYWGIGWGVLGILTLLGLFMKDTDEK